MEAKVYPGVRQDHLGRFYQAAIDEHGKDIIIFVQPANISEDSLAAMEPVIVESLAYALAQTIEPKNEKQRRKLEAVIACGPTYQSIMFFHRSI